MDPVFITSRNTLWEFAGWDFVSDLHTNIFICRVAIVIWNEAKTLLTFHDFLKLPGGFIFSKVVGTINPATLLGDHSFSTCAKFSEKLTFLTP